MMRNEREIDLMGNFVMTKWIKIFPNDEANHPTDEDCGFSKKNSDGYHMGGCYLYAYDPSDSIAGEAPDFLDDRVIYIGTAGSSKSRGIRSRTADFMGTVVKGYEQKNPYANGILFRGKYGEENKKHLYVAYIPQGYGSDIKLQAHQKENEMLREYREFYGSLPPCDGAISNEIIFDEMIKVSTEDQRQRWIEKLQKYA